MNYDDASQQPQQQFYMQRMPGQQQRMVNFSFYNSNL
jgi:hypothetical protein